MATRMGCILVHDGLLKLCMFIHSHGPALRISGINNLWNFGPFVYNLEI